MDIKSIKGKPGMAPPPTLDEQLKTASKMYERQFLDEMMRAMKKTVDHSDLTKPSMAENIYTDEMYSLYADKWAEQGGNGLADVIYKELKEKILPSQNSRYLPPSAAAAESYKGLNKKIVK